MMTHSDAVRSALLTISDMGGRAWARQVGLFRDRRDVPRLIGTRGEADVSGILPTGTAIAVEVKTGAASRTPDQIAWGRMWVRMRGVYVVARYSDCEDGDAAIRAAIEEHYETRGYSRAA